MTNLKGGASNVIGVIAASKANQYYATLVGALEDAVEVHGYSCFVADVATNGIYLPAREDRLIESMIQQRVATVVLTSSIDDRNLTLLESWKIPVLSSFLCRQARAVSSRRSLCLKLEYS